MFDAFLCEIFRKIAVETKKNTLKLTASLHTISNRITDVAHTRSCTQFNHISGYNKWYEVQST